MLRTHINRVTHPGTVTLTIGAECIQPSKMRIVYPSADDVAGAMLGSGDIPVYSGSLSQKGYGIGGLLRGIASKIMPIFFAKAKSALGNAALGVVKDTVSGVPITEALKTHAAAEGRKILGDAVGSLGQTVLEGKMPTALRQRGDGRRTMRARMSRKRASQGKVKTRCKKLKRVSQ